jgi:hypothetical protein
LGDRPIAAIVALHVQLRDRFLAEAREHELRGHRFSWLRLGTFLGATVVGIASWQQRSLGLLGLAVLLMAGFIAAVFAHGKTLERQAGALRRSEIHVRHLARLGLGWMRFTHKGEGLLQRDHPYARDIDLIGQGSLFQRIDVTHTLDGEDTLAHWLGAAAPPELLPARQAAVLELRDQLEFRQELEAAGIHGEKLEKLDGGRVAALASMPSLFATRPWLMPAARALPIATLTVLLLGAIDVLPGQLWILVALPQVALLYLFGKQIRPSLDLVTAKAPALEAYEALLVHLERAQFESPLLQELKARVSFGDVPPSRHLSRLSFWVGLAEVRQSLIHPLLNPILLWDLNVLYGIEGFVRDAGARAGEWFRAIGELEALASLATLAHGDPSAIMPELGDERAPLTAAELAHPLLAPNVRVANDLHLRGPGTALVVTGSNMAGKSTLLRAVGQNIALALAGGPVIARRMCVPRVRLRASMRADDSLESGSSYFAAELTTLKRVIDGAEDTPPVLFLLDELLRGTNARARHVGAKAVLLHLLSRSATGLCATHDVELAALGNSDATHIENVHFTDVMQNGEMVFDYRLRPGIVRTSNALRLLALAGIDVPADERRALEGTGARPDEARGKHEAVE